MLVAIRKEGQQDRPCLLNVQIHNSSAWQGYTSIDFQVLRDKYSVDPSGCPFDEAAPAQATTGWILATFCHWRLARPLKVQG
jgi:hypothetical protein